MALTFAQVYGRVYKGVLRDDLLGSYQEFVNEALREIQNRRSFTCMKNTTFVSVLPGVQGAGGNVVPLGSVWPTGAGTLTFTISGFSIGSTYFFNPGNSSGLTTDGVTPVSLTSNIFTATQNSYVLTATADKSAQIITAVVITNGLNQMAALPADFKELQKRPAIHYVTDDGQFIPTDVVNEWQQIFRVWAFGGTPITTWPPRAYLDRRATGAFLGLLEPLTMAFNFRVQYYKYLPNLVNDTDTSPFFDDSSFAYPKMVIAKAKAIAFSEVNDPAAELFEDEFEKKLAEAIRQDAYSEVVGKENRM